MHRPIVKSDVPGYVVDQSSGAILNNDEEAWLKYKAQRDTAQELKQLKSQVAQLLIRVAQLEENNK